MNRIGVETRGDLDCVTVTLRGTLDSSTYRQVRDRVITSALEGPDVVLVDVEELCVECDSAWTAFASARWYVSTWPGVPVMLVCSDPDRRARISATAHTLPVHPTAPTDFDGPRRRPLQRNCIELPADEHSLRGARVLVTRWLTDWGRSQSALTAATVATILVENTLRHAGGAPRLVVEAFPDVVAVAVSDDSHLPAVRHEDAKGGAHTVSGLAIVAALSRAWGSTPMAGGKTVWALLGPENHL